jgi:hypothetical protein
MAILPEHVLSVKAERFSVAADERPGIKRPRQRPVITAFNCLQIPSLNFCALLHQLEACSLALTFTAKVRS